ncbi:MBL fold metallo-hydrolase [Bradyrhizobium sp. SSBR45G]|uniref:MBL fold metallo-hydrolase n=1 Tax=unclassified Bradyrhizobium TaxID=2631580 RepID=UPI002342A663|nr:MULTISPECIES: MBL fold metallo-hydrolase [unclassified Bradyrhizobium]GLH79908.1 MBL fold metallo-hydrolase [Bradyrhizobium sp. SSBR45G]GLH87284.1 MBL fold metallo-hydrolase [Bradyrhizobium sp. SSBR45R]
MLSAATAAAAFGLDAGLAVVDAKPRRRTEDPERGFCRITVGEAEVIALYDGIWEKPHEAGFFSNASISDVKDALRAAGFNPAFVPIPISTYVVRLKGKTVLCDAGGGGQVQGYNSDSIFISGRMLDNLKAAGIRPQEIDTILISHFHPDHIFGLLREDSDAPVFPNAEIIVAAAEHKFWTDPALTSRLPPWRQSLARRIQSVIPSWKNVLPVEGEDEVVPGIRFVSAPGHTPGHTAFHLSSGPEQLMISGDTAYVPAFCLRHPEWHGAYDQDGPAAEVSRRKLLDRIVADRMLICGSHFPWPGFGRLVRDGAHYALDMLPA